jgi:NAD(P)-dependent dehydrogenase (short-subunit alcohol dehydrogenase family)
MSNRMEALRMTDSLPPTLDALRSGATERAFLETTALVTGANSGIGRAIALALAAEGRGVCLVGRNRDRLKQAAIAAREAGAGKLLAVPADLTHEDDLERLAASATGHFGDIDILVHCAGEYARAPFEAAAPGQMDALYAANVRAPYRLTQLLLPSLRRRKGDILFINSTQGLAASGAVGQFAATQHALRALADSLREEINAAGIRVTTLHVGSTATPRQERIFAATGRDYMPDRLIQPDDVASLAVAILRLPHSAEVTNLTMRPMQKP